MVSETEVKGRKLRERKKIRHKNGTFALKDQMYYSYERDKAAAVDVE